MPSSPENVVARRVGDPGDADLVGQVDLTSHQAVAGHSGLFFLA